MRTCYAPSLIKVVGETGQGCLARSVCTSKGRQEMLLALWAASQRRWALPLFVTDNTGLSK